MPLTVAINGARVRFALSYQTDHSFPLSKLHFLQRMASNDKGMMVEEVESSTVRKHLWHTDADGGDDDSSDSLEEEPEEEVEMDEEEDVSSKETLLNQVDTFEEKLYARCTRGILFKDDGDTPSMSSETPCTPESHRRSDEESNDDDDFWM
jgi:hypothetical protein